MAGMNVQFTVMADGAAVSVENDQRFLNLKLTIRLPIDNLVDVILEAHKTKEPRAVPAKPRPQAAVAARPATQVQ
eukprot:CAMPEP_0204337208 /NCGR_PEP_ID=MMETSP0469-20131031/20137_1 /ASSEMBLY_ACC=CAM_ASM_000384 /TAXON_ID=2969 /ORGANISM="Oxyrrhis marina" /LENGTH=74 /DNA_ID=CAMNT_0051321201 /DNA_START=151 /DNA_END=372 /DNA_ORIENTATION=+